MCNKQPARLFGNYLLHSCAAPIWEPLSWRLSSLSSSWNKQADFIHELWNRHSKVTPVTSVAQLPLAHALERRRPVGNSSTEKPALSCYGQPEASLLCCCSFWSTKFSMLGCNCTWLRIWFITVHLGDGHPVTTKGSHPWVHIQWLPFISRMQCSSDF